MRAAPLPRRILIVRLGAIGDVVNALVLAAAIKDADPEVELGWAVHALSAPVLVGNPVVDRVHLWDRDAGLGGVRALLGELRAAQYDLAIDLQRLFKSGLVARLSGARRVLGFDRARTKELAWLFTRERLLPGDPGGHMVEQYLDFAAHLGLERSARHSLPSDPGAEAWVEQLLAAAPFDGRAPIGIGVGASYASKRWPAERFVQLARRAAATTGLPVLLLGGPGDRAAAADELAGLAADPAPGVVDLVGSTSLAQLIAVLGRLRCFVSSDTGPMHLAVARGRTSVALFGPGEAQRTGPYQDPRPGRPVHGIVRVPPDCAPCNKRSCRMERHHCMLDIGVELVLEAVAAALARTAEDGAPLPVG